MNQCEKCKAYIGLSCDHVCTISDEARELERKLYLIHNGVDNSVEAERIIQSALTAARVKALEDAANTVLTADTYDGRFIIAKAIRAMKAQS